MELFIAEKSSNIILIIYSSPHSSHTALFIAVLTRTVYRQVLYGLTSRRLD